MGGACNLPIIVHTQEQLIDVKEMHGEQSVSESPDLTVL